MHLIKALSIKRKLILIMMATSCTAIFLMAFFIVVNQAFKSQRSIQQQLITLADVLGSTSTGAITFDDPTAGTEILNALTLKPNIVYAFIERANGEIFVEFGEKFNSYLSKDMVSKQTNGGSAPLWSELFANEIQVSREIYLDNELIGKIWIVSTLDELHNDVLNFMFLVAIISAICFALTFLICTRLQKVISDPIVNLHSAMDAVSENKDYSLRVENSEENEFGTLVDGFNHMLEQIQLRDDQIADYSTHLEKIVAERTLQLTDANKKRIVWLETMARFLRHELKNSSVGIKTSLDLIERRSAQKHKIDVYLARARRSMANMNALLQGAGDASDLEAILYKEEHKPLDLSKTVTIHMEMYSSIYPGVSILADCPDGILVCGNENRLTQLLDKLIANAVEHSDRSQPIEVIVKKHLGNAQLIVKNQGDALPKDKKTMFDLFVSFRPTERKTDDNFGLGLYIVKLITESHGGNVEAHDLNGGSGAVFIVTLPLIHS